MPETIQFTDLPLEKYIPYQKRTNAAQFSDSGNIDAPE